MATIGNRGKWAEGRVKAFLKKHESASFTHHRFPDARAGSMVVSPCDFMFIRSGVLTLLEVKEVNHPFRLPHKNFSPDQVARMRSWQSAGARAYVVVAFNTGRWRGLPLDYFMIRTGGSWNMEAVPDYTEKEVLDAAILQQY